MAVATAIAALAAVGGSVYAADQQKKATNSANAATAAQVKSAQGALTKRENRGSQIYQQGINETKLSYDQAISATSNLGATARRRLMRREKSSMGRSDANLANRGLYNSTRALNQRRAIQTDTNFGLGAIDESVSQIQAGIYRDRAHTMGSLYGNFARSIMGMGQAQSGLIMAPTHVAGDMSGIGQGIGQLAQLLAMYGASGE